MTFLSIHKICIFAYLAIIPFQILADDDRAPRAKEIARIENAMLEPELEQTACCSSLRDITITGDLFVGATPAGTLNIDIPTPFTVSDGGTGVATLPAHGVLLGEGTSAIAATAVGATNTVLLGNTGADPSFGVVPNAALANSSITLQNGSNISITGSPVSLGDTATINLVDSPVVSGSLTAGTTITAGTGITATTGNINITSGNLDLGFATATTGNITQNGALLLHVYPSISSIFLGLSAGNNTVSNQGSNSNVGVGFGAMYNISQGYANVAVGTSALVSLTTGIANTAVGYRALDGLTTGSWNTAIGDGTGKINTLNDSYNTYIGAGLGVTGESYATRLGNSQGVNACYIQGINTINLGTTANLVGVIAGATGTNADRLGTVATIFTATGSISATAAIQAQTTITAGTGITATTGNITATSGNVVITAGNLTLPNSTATTGNITKAGILFMHNAGANNTFLGANAGNLTTTGTGLNVGIGTLALAGLTTGTSNTAIGRAAGANIGAGSHNVFIGQSAGLSYTLSDSANISIGAGQTGIAGESFTTRIGNATGGSTTKCFISGIRGITTVNANAIGVLIDSAGQLGTISSSRRYKENIIDLEDSAQRFMQLRPVIFNYTSDASRTMQYGLIAEEVEQVYPELVVYNENGEVDTVKYHLLYALLIKMIQENRKVTEENRMLIKELFELCSTPK